MPLLNVRLSADDARRAAELREDGIQISDIVREAIRAEYLRRRDAHASTRRRPSLIVSEILAALPDPEGPRRPVVDTTDRRAVRRHIADKLRSRRK